MKEAFAEWQNGWEAIVDPNEAEYLGVELDRETRNSPKHKLFGLIVKFIARWPADDDFLVILETGDYAYIHLTWSQETDSKWPYTEILVGDAALRDFLNRWNK